jgi:predicted TIM-barrel fold metal-dependent hydrolase
MVYPSMCEVKMNDIIDINTLFGPQPSAAEDLSSDELSEMMQKNGVRCCVTLSTIGALLDHKTGNAATLAACSGSSNLAPAATLNPQFCFNPETAAADILAQAFRMVRFFPFRQKWDPEYAPFLALVKALSRKNLPIMINIDQNGMATRMMRSIGDTSSPIILSGVNSRWAAEAVQLMREHENLYLETSFLLAEGMIKQTAQEVGAARLLFGSGAPSRPMASGIGVLRHSGLSDSDLSLILHSNASRLFGL